MRSVLQSGGASEDKNVVVRCESLELSGTAQLSCSNVSAIHLMGDYKLFVLYPQQKVYLYQYNMTPTVKLYELKDGTTCQINTNVGGVVWHENGGNPYITSYYSSYPASIVVCYYE